MPYISARDLTWLKEIRKAATFERASFHPFDADGETKDSEVREATRIFREAWIVEPLDEIITRIEKSASKPKRRFPRGMTHDGVVR